MQLKGASIFHNSFSQKHEAINPENVILDKLQVNLKIQKLKAYTEIKRSAYGVVINK